MDFNPNLAEICQRLSNNDPSLTNLDLSRKNLSDDGIIQFAPFLSKNTHLKTLLVGWNRIGPKGAIALARSLPQSSVEKLTLSGNEIGNDGATAIGEILPKAPLLKMLYLASNQIGNEGAKSLCCGVMKQSPPSSLEYLSLSSNNGIGNEGAKSLGKMLQGNHSLKTFYLLDCEKIGKRGQRALARGTKYNVVLDHYLIVGIRDHLQIIIDDYRRLNRSGLRFLREDNDWPRALWANIFSKFQKEPNLIFYFVRAKPALFKR